MTSANVQSEFVFRCSDDINQIKDSLWLHMYDEVIEDIAPSDSTSTTSEIYQKISSHYLGELVIPFSTILASQRVVLVLVLLSPDSLF